MGGVWGCLGTTGGQSVTCRWHDAGRSAGADVRPYMADTINISICPKSTSRAAVCQRTSRSELHRSPLRCETFIQDWGNLIIFL